MHRQDCNNPTTMFASPSCTQVCGGGAGVSVHRSKEVSTSRHLLATGNIMQAVLCALCHAHRHLPGYRRCLHATSALADWGCAQSKCLCPWQRLDCAVLTANKGSRCLQAELSACCFELCAGALVVGSCRLRAQVCARGAVGRHSS